MDRTSALVAAALVAALSPALAAQNQPQNNVPQDCPDQFYFLKKKTDFVGGGPDVALDKTAEGWVLDATAKQLVEANGRNVLEVTGKVRHKVGPHAGEGEGKEWEFTAKIAANGEFIDGKAKKPGPNNGPVYVNVEKSGALVHQGNATHFDRFVVRVSAETDDAKKIYWFNVIVEGIHRKGPAEDGGPQLKVTPIFFTGGTPGVGSDGVKPRIEIWSPDAYSPPIGTSYGLFLIEDVTLPLSTTTPILMLSAPTDTAFAGAVQLPLDLEPFGAPGFGLFVDPTVFLPAEAPTGNHHAQVQFSVPDDSSLIGVRVYAQWMLNDPTANALGKTFTEGMVLHITP